MQDIGYGINHSFINIPYIYSSSLFNGARGLLKKWAKRNIGKKKIIIAYSLTSYTIKALDYVKTINPNITTAIFVPDLPQYTYRDSYNLSVKLKNYFGKSKVLNAIDRHAYKVDAWLLFSAYMSEELPDCKNILVFEGVSSDEFDSLSIHEKDNVAENEFIVLYAGGLHENYGLRLLLDAMKLLKDRSIRCCIAGKGSMESEIISISHNDNRIQFLGEIPRDMLLNYEVNSHLLINPRASNEKFTRYSFPSKNMEYLSSGVPMLGYKLTGIPEEYDLYINYFEYPTAESIAESIDNIRTNYSYYKRKAKEAQRFVYTAKSAEAWGEKILKFLDNI